MNPENVRRATKLRSDRVRSVIGIVSREHVRFAVSFSPEAIGAIECPGAHPLRAQGSPLSFALREIWTDGDGPGRRLGFARYTISEARAAWRSSATTTTPRRRLKLIFTLAREPGS